MAAPASLSLSRPVYISLSHIMDAIGAPFCHYHRVCGWGFLEERKKKTKKIFPLFFELFSSYLKIEIDRNVKKVFLMPSGSLSISIVIITKGRRNGLTCRPPSAQDEETISIRSSRMSTCHPCGVKAERRRRKEGHAHFQLGCNSKRIPFFYFYFIFMCAAILESISLPLLAHPAWQHPSILPLQ
jgi:hypothetical protein